MIEPGSIIVLQVLIESDKGASMNDLDFSLDFYVERDRNIHCAKVDLVKVVDESIGYYAIINTDLVGRGRLMCRATINDDWQGHFKKVVLTEYTGVSIGEYSRTANPAFQAGYRLRFDFKPGIIKPEPAATYVFYGKIIDTIASFSDVTEDLLLAPGNTVTKISGKPSREGIDVQAGDKVVVLVPAESEMYAAKDDGIGGKEAFDTSIMGANGEYIVPVEGNKYRLYGELMTVSGTLYIYVT